MYQIVWLSDNLDINENKWRFKKISQPKRCRVDQISILNNSNAIDFQVAAISTLQIIQANFGMDDSND